MKDKTQDDLESQAAALIADQQTARITEASTRLLGDADRLRHLAEKWKNVAPEIAQGRSFEQIFVVKFNLDALQKGRLDVRAFTTDSVGRPTDPVDIYIQQARKKIPFQAKSCDNPVASLTSLTDKLDESKYRGMGRLAPSEQYEKIKSLLEKRVRSGSLKQAQYEDTLKNLRRELSLDGVASGDTTHAEALSATNRQVADKMANGFERQTIKAEMHRSGLEAGKTGAIVAGGVSTVGGLLRLSRGEANPGEVVAQVAVDAAKGYASSYATTAISKGVPHLLIQGGASQSATTLLTRSNAHVAIAAGVVQSGKSIVRYLRGEINGEQLSSEVSHTAITGASAFYYGALGQAIIPIPIVGAFVGSTFGYFVGNMLHQSALISLGESVSVKAARERREHVESLCMTAIPLMRAHRLELEALMCEHFAERHQLLTTAFDGLESSMIEWDADGFTAKLELVNNAFGASLPFKSLTEFDAFMADDDQSFIL
ncbi:hypothetical protein [Aromatoleum evansii]|uniref:hypothetical protein n=1 Tax=Aromatoleum evansii TaxID=59406 RepID=UPI00145CFEF6|nr:hypothetical protein [Aromatoleum evansii]NMG31094.1 hypothetical protein [Aromatoleum evansii]